MSAIEEHKPAEKRRALGRGIHGDDGFVTITTRTAVLKLFFSPG